MFGRRRRDEAAAEAAREDERRALFARLAERPENICPFLGLAGERTGYVDGVSDEHRCFAFGDPAPLSAEQQTRVCQERGYGNCPRYLRGVLVIPTEELEALRRPRAPMPEPTPAPPPPPPDERRRRGFPIALLVGAMILLVGGFGAYLALFRDGGIAVTSPSASAEASPDASAGASPPSSAGATDSGPATPTAEPTPEPGDAFAFYEVSVGPEEYQLFDLGPSGSVDGRRVISFDAFSFARAEPAQADDGTVFWLTLDGDLAGWSYTYPDSGEFRIRAVYLGDDGSRRSLYLETEDLTLFPEATPPPAS